MQFGFDKWLSAYIFLGHREKRLVITESTVLESGPSNLQICADRPSSQILCETLDVKEEFGNPPKNEREVELDLRVLPRKIRFILLISTKQGECSYPLSPPKV